MKVTLIHNPDAGDDEQPSRDELVKLIRGAGHNVAYQSSKDGEWVNRLKEPGDIVAVAGGDGIVGKVAKRLIGARIPIAILPLGTANNIAKTLGLTDVGLEQLIRGWSSAGRARFDVGVATGPWGSTCFLEGVGMGLFTQTMYRLDARDNIDLAHVDDSEEKITSVLEILKERLQNCPAKSLELTVDDQELSGDYLLMEVLNIKSVGPNLYLAPGADPGDGLLDVVLVSKEEKEKLDGYLSDCIRGNPRSPDLTVYRGKRLQLEWEGSVIHIDDEVWPDNGSTPARQRTGIDIRLNQEALEFVVPA